VRSADATVGRQRVWRVYFRWFESNMSCEFSESFQIREEGALNLDFNLETYIRWVLI